MAKILLTLTLILAGLITGYLLQQWLRQNYRQRQHLLLPNIRKSLQRLSMLGILPISFIGALWIIPFDDLRVAVLPFLGAGVILLGGLFGLLAAKILGRQGSQRSVLFCCGCFTNIGSLGGLTSFIFFGEQGFALLVLYRMFEELIYYGFGFPVARFLGSQEQNPPMSGQLLELARDPFFLVAILSFTAGLGLNLAGVERPLFYETLNSYFVPTGIFLLLVSIGLGLRFSKVRNYLVDGLAVAVIKFIALPCCAGIAAYLLGLHEIENGLPLQIVLLAASMPVAFNALVAASLYDLDLDLANGCWLLTTASLIVILPWLYFLFSWLPT
jgi:predicted permease